MLLDTASNINFFGSRADQGMILVENLAVSGDDNGEDYDRSIKDSGGHEDQIWRDIKALSEKFDKMM